MTAPYQIGNSHVTSPRRGELADMRARRFRSVGSLVDRDNSFVSDCPQTGRNSDVDDCGFKVLNREREPLGRVRSHLPFRIDRGIAKDRTIVWSEAVVRPFAQINALVAIDLCDKQWLAGSINDLHGVATHDDDRLNLSALVHPCEKPSKKRAGTRCGCEAHADPFGFDLQSLPLSVVSAHSTVAAGGKVASLPTESPGLCTTCDARLDDMSIRACSVRDCPNAQKDAA